MESKKKVDVEINMEVKINEVHWVMKMEVEMKKMFLILNN